MSKAGEIIAEATAGLVFASEASGEEFAFYDVLSAGEVQVREYDDDGEVIGTYTLRLTVEEN